MKTLNWRHIDWSARNFIFSIGEKIVGQLNFYSLWNFNASYTDGETQLKFTQKNFLDRDIVITKEGKPIGEIVSGLWGNQTLKLSTGERFNLSTNAWGRNVCWKTETGETVVKYEQASIRSMGKGLIRLQDSLDMETEKLLVSSGLFIRQLTMKRSSLLAVFIILIAAASRG